jgi:hypothetical protein
MTRHRAGRFIRLALLPREKAKRGRPPRHWVKLRPRPEDPGLTPAEFRRRKKRRQIAAHSTARNRR